MASAVTHPQHTPHQPGGISPTNEANHDGESGGNSNDEDVHIDDAEGEEDELDADGDGDEDMMGRRQQQGGNTNGTGTVPLSAAAAAAVNAAKRYRPAPTKTFQCRGFGECTMVFSRSEHLARHIRKHTGERPFSCHCGKQFSRLDNLRQHAQTVHADKQDQNEKMMRDLTSLHATMAAANKVVGGGGGGGGGRRRGPAKDVSAKEAKGGAKATSRPDGSPPLVQPKKEDLGGLIPFQTQANHTVRPGTSTGYEGEMYWPPGEEDRRGVRGIPPRSGGGSHSFRDPRHSQSFLAPTHEHRSAGGPSAPGQSFRFRVVPEQYNGRFHVDRDRPRTSIDPTSSFSRTSSSSGGGRDAYSRPPTEPAPVYLERPRTSAVGDAGYGYGPASVYSSGGRPRPSTSAAPSSTSGRVHSRPTTSSGYAAHDAFAQRPATSAESRSGGMGSSRPGTAGAAPAPTLPPLSAVVFSSQRGEREYASQQREREPQQQSQRLLALPGSRPDSGYGGPTQYDFYGRGSRRYEYDEYEYAGRGRAARDYDDDDDDGYGGGYGGSSRPTTAPAFFSSRAPDSLRMGGGSARTELPPLAPPPGSSRGRYASPPRQARSYYASGAGSPIQWDDDDDERRRRGVSSRRGAASPIRADSPIGVDEDDEDDENGGNPFYFQPPALVPPQQQPQRQFTSSRPPTGSGRPGTGAAAAAALPPPSSLIRPGTRPGSSYAVPIGGLTASRPPTSSGTSQSLTSAGIVPSNTRKRTLAGPDGPYDGVGHVELGREHGSLRAPSSAGLPPEQRPSLSTSSSSSTSAFSSGGGGRPSTATFEYGSRPGTASRRPGSSYEYGSDSRPVSRRLSVMELCNDDDAAAAAAGRSEGGDDEARDGVLLSGASGSRGSDVARAFDRVSGNRNGPQWEWRGSPGSGGDRGLLGRTFSSTSSTTSNSYPSGRQQQQQQRYQSSPSATPSPHAFHPSISAANASPHASYGSSAANVSPLLYGGGGSSRPTTASGLGIVTSTQAIRLFDRDSPEARDIDVDGDVEIADGTRGLSAAAAARSGHRTFTRTRPGAGSAGYSRSSFDRYTTRDAASASRRLGRSEESPPPGDVFERDEDAAEVSAIYQSGGRRGSSGAVPPAGYAGHTVGYARDGGAGLYGGKEEFGASERYGSAGGHFAYAPRDGRDRLSSTSAAAGGVYASRRIPSPASPASIVPLSASPSGERSFERDSERALLPISERRFSYDAYDSRYGRDGRRGVHEAAAPHVPLHGATEPTPSSTVATAGTSSTSAAAVSPASEGGPAPFVFGRVRADGRHGEFAGGPPALSASQSQEPFEPERGAKRGRGADSDDESVETVDERERRDGPLASAPAAAPTSFERGTGSLSPAPSPTTATAPRSAAAVLAGSPSPRGPSAASYVFGREHGGYGFGPPRRRTSSPGGNAGAGPAPSTQSRFATPSSPVHGSPLGLRSSPLSAPPAASAPPTTTSPAPPIAT